MATPSIRILPLAVLLLAACGAQPTPSMARPPAAATAPAPTSQSNKLAESRSAEPKPAEAPAPSVEMPSVDFDAPDSSVDAWFASHGIKDATSKSLQELASLPQSMNVECDRVVPVGKPFEKAALCRRQYLEGQWELATSYLLLVPEAGKLSVIWQATSAAGLLSKTDTSEQPFVQLDVSVQDDGLVLYLEDTADYSCADARVRFQTAKRDAASEEKQSLAALERAATSICRGRGKYAWRGRSFVRTGPVPPRAPD